MAYACYLHCSHPLTPFDGHEKISYELHGLLQEAIIGVHKIFSVIMTKENILDMLLMIDVVDEPKKNIFFLLRNSKNNGQSNW